MCPREFEAIEILFYIFWRLYVKWKLDNFYRSLSFSQNVHNYLLMTDKTSDMKDPAEKGRFPRRAAHFKF